VPYHNGFQHVTHLFSAIDPTGATSTVWPGRLVHKYRLATAWRSPRRLAELTTLKRSTRKASCSQRRHGQEWTSTCMSPTAVIWATGRLQASHHHQSGDGRNMSQHHLQRPNRPFCRAARPPDCPEVMSAIWAGPASSTVPIPTGLYDNRNGLITRCSHWGDSVLPSIRRTGPTATRSTATPGNYRNSRIAMRPRQHGPAILPAAGSTVKHLPYRRKTAVRCSTWMT